MNKQNSLPQERIRRREFFHLYEERGRVTILEKGEYE